MTRILITGGSGFLGHNIAPVLAKGHEVFQGYFRNTPSAASGMAVAIDITQPARLLEQFEVIQPDIVVHAAAMTQPDECEEHPEEARLLIVEGTRNVARACAACGCRLIHVSTDLVFDGRRGHYLEGDPVTGISIYSNSKIEAEKVVQEIAASATILRVALLYGQGTAAHPGNIESTLRSWRAGRPLTFYTDQYRTPLFARQAAEVIEALLARPDFRGILHVGGGERVSRFAFAELLAQRVNAPRRLLQPGSMWESKAVAPRGADCSLTSAKLQSELGIRPLTCSEGLDTLVRSGYLEPLSNDIPQSH